MSTGAATAPTNLEELKAIFAAHGGTANDYLERHWRRFAQTKREVEATRPLPTHAAVLDVGAHWLHQSALYACAGCHVSALDLPLTLNLPNVVATAKALGIQRLVNADLEHIPALHDVPDDHFDLVLFTEIIEHITFNPVAMWREIYRVTKPGGRIVVTTPNYYAWRRRARNGLRFVCCLGGGPTVSDILNLHTYGHHWKEYSRRELLGYFRSLSPDFECIKALYVDKGLESQRNKLSSRLAAALSPRIPLLRRNLHLEVQIRAKDKGIAVEPHW